MELVSEAIAFAAKAHDGMRRKKSDAPYILHPMEAAVIVGTMTDDQNLIAAAALHDVVEDTDISLISVDSLGLSPDFIKYDVEGAELEALIGTRDTILKKHPTMLVSLYHRSRDLFYIPNMIAREYPFYRMTLRRLKCLPAWEIDLLLFDN